jgi:hypothetical protein
LSFCWWIYGSQYLDAGDASTDFLTEFVFIAEKKEYPISMIETT